MVRLLLRALACAAALTLGVARPGLPAVRSEKPVRVYVFAGQSNMVGKETDAAELPPTAEEAAGALFWGPFADAPVSWGPLRAPTEVLQPASHRGFGPEIGAAPLLARRHPGATIATVKFAVGGTSLYRDWAPGREDGLYARMIAGVRSALADLRRREAGPVHLSGFFWMQGESDTEHIEHARAYGENLAAFVRAVRSDLRAPELPFVLGRIRDLRRDHAVHYQHSDVVRRAQVEVARTVPSTFMVPTEGIDRSASKLHFSSRGTLELGRRFVKPSFPL